MFSFGKNGKSKGASGSHDVAAIKADIVDKVSSAIMMVDRDFVVTYANEGTRILLANNLEALRKVWPSLDPENIVGVCIDQFHKNPGHQRKLLADPKNLPLKTEISVGDLKIALAVDGCFDAEGNLVGHSLEWRDISNDGLITAINKVQAVIEFRLDGTIVTANDNFLKAMGYTLDEVRNQHHSMFVDPAYKGSPEYKAFWEKLNRGEYDAAQYKRIGKGGKEVWIQASYNPILDGNGKAFKVVKFATDITEQKAAFANFEGQLDAISKAQAVIEFSLDGRILTANENFLNTLGYSKEEVRGQHHSMFVEPSYRSSPDYRLFWEKLGRGAKRDLLVGVSPRMRRNQKTPVATLGPAMITYGTII